MPRDVKEYRVFVASPGDLKDERLAFRDVIHEYNQSEAGLCGVHFVPIGCEDTSPRMGRAQSIINCGFRAMAISVPI
jgi:hypothetical protein